MRAFTLGALAVTAAAVHYAHRSPAGAAAYLFLGAMLVASFAYSRGMHGQNYWLSLTGLIEAWFVFDYAVYGTALAVLERSKMPLPASMAETYSRAYLVGTLAFVAFACGAYAAFARGAHASHHRKCNTRVIRRVFLLFTAAGVASLIILLLDPESLQQLFFEHVGLSPRAGMGRYTSLFFMLPTTAICLWYLSSSNRRRFRLLSVAGLFLLAALHLGCGRRLMWAASMLLIFHLLKLRGIFTLRARYVALALPLVILVSAWMEASKNMGWYTAVGRIQIYELADANKVFDMVDNSVGRFDATAALIANRETLPYYHGQTFLLAPLQILPVSAGMERSRGIREELGELIYGAFGQGLVSQEASLVGELYANFSYAGVLLGFLSVGFAAAYLDSRYHHSRHPPVAIGYGLCLFRVVHQLATASTSWFPLTFLAFLPWLVAIVLARLAGRGARA